MIGMEWAFAALAALAALWLGLRPARRGRDRAARSPYVARKSLLSPAERSFLGVLEQAVGEEYRVYAKVRLADLVEVRSMRDNSRRQQALNRIASNHVDFVLCTPAERVIMAAVELDDGSPERRDPQLDDICRSARLPLVRIAAKRSYAVGDIRREVLRALGGPTGPELGPLDDIAEADDRRAPTLPPPDAPAADAPVCPECRAPMIAGHEGWRCSHYLDCPGERPFRALR